jgi:signal transduction histidine kinase
MSQVTPVTARRRLGQAMAFARAAEPRRVMSRRSVITDLVFAALVLVASLIAAGFHYPAVVAAVVTTAPLAARRRFPLAVFLLVLLGTLATKDYATDITFLAVVIAAYSAVVYSRFRGAALICTPLAGVVVAVAFWNAKSSLHTGSAAHPAFPRHIPGLVFVPQAPWRLAGVLVLVSLVSIAIVGIAAYAGDRIRRLQAGHEADTRRALELERARIASELHDVVTHNVSVMIVQAGAARQVLADAPGEARAALLAVESSGRAAMTELRHLLGLLSPLPAPGEGAEADAADSQGQPGPVAAAGPGAARGPYRPGGRGGAARRAARQRRAAGPATGPGPGGVPRRPGGADQRDQARGEAADQRQHPLAREQPRGGGRRRRAADPGRRACRPRRRAGPAGAARADGAVRG